MLRKLALHISHYSAASLLVNLAGLFSFPFLTRFFTVADYGVMNLISATLTLLVGVGKLGLQHAIIRFEPEIRANRTPYDRRTFYSTTVLGMAGTGLVAAAAWAAFNQLLPADWLLDRRLGGLFALTSIFIVFRCLDSCLTNHLRAEQQSQHLMAYQVGSKYLALALMIGVLLWIAPTLRGFYFAGMATEAVGVLVLFIFLFGPGTGRPLPTPDSFSPSLYRELLQFGIPMMIGYELSGVILNVGDRYIIHYLLPGDSLGIYTAAYNLCQYVQTVCVYSLTQAVMPIYMRLWAERGEEETRQFLAGVLHHYVLIAAPIVAGMAAVGPHLLPFVASEKYGSGASVIPYVMAGMIFDGANVVAGAGLFIHKESRVIMRLVVCGAAFNVVLNTLLIPRIGLTGAAVATLLSYAALTASMARAGSKRLRISLPWGALAKAVSLSFLMYWLVTRIQPEGRVVTIAIRVAMGVVIYGVLVALIDRKAREALRFGFGRLTGQVSGPGGASGKP